MSHDLKRSFIIFFILFPVVLSGQNKLVFSVSELQTPPFVAVERILRKAYGELGIDLEYREFPGRRSIVMANSGITDGELYRTPVIEERYTDLIRVNVILQESFLYLYVREGKEFNPEGWESIPSNLVLGYQRGIHIVESLIDKYHLSSIGSSSLEQQFLQFLNGRSDILILGGVEALEYLKKPDFQNLVRLEPFILKVELYHYLHKKNVHIQPEITKVLKRMKEAGEF
jgi:hypothetical protein